MISKYKQKCIREGLRFRKAAAAPDEITYQPLFPFPLMRLPPQLRLQIFEYIIANGWNPNKLNELPTLKEQAILRTCPQIRQEAMEAWRNSLLQRKQDMPRGDGEEYTWDQIRAGKAKKLGANLYWVVGEAIWHG